MLVFAQSADLEKWAGEPVPENAEQLLRSASVKVQRAVRRARFSVTPAGMPSDPDVMDALRDATCAQAAFWDASDVDPNKADTAPRLSTTSLADASFGYDTATASNTSDRAARELCEEALDILDNAGLLGGAVWAV